MSMFLLTHSPPPDTNLEKSFIAYIDSAKFIEDWTHPFVCFFIFTSDWPIETLSERLREFFPPSISYFLVEAGGAPFEAQMSVDSFGWLKDVGALIRDDEK